ncbi:unnamed protein product [Schistosoma turkestanicum]|nr:unnamed protein product [Schistosoma turkestanicum]
MKKRNSRDSKQIEEYVHCTNTRLHGERGLKLMKEIPLSQFLPLKHCFNKKAETYQNIVSNYSEEKCLEYLPPVDKDVIKYFGETGELHKVIDQINDNIVWLNHLSFENQYLSDIVKEIDSQFETRGFPLTILIIGVMLGVFLIGVVCSVLMYR